MNGKIGDRIKLRRLELGLSQKDLAKRAGVSYSSIQNWESGGFPNTSKLNSLAEALECNENWLVSNQLPKERLVSFGDRLKSFAKEDDPLWGQTKRHEINGKKVDVTLFQSSSGHDRYDPDSMSIKAFYTAMRLLIMEMERSPARSGWFQIEFMNRFPELSNDINNILRLGGFIVDDEKED